MSGASLKDQIIQKNFLKAQGKRAQSSQSLSKVDSLMGGIQSIDEEDQEYYNEIFIDELESGDTGSILERGQSFFDHFEASEIMP